MGPCHAFPFSKNKSQRFLVMTYAASQNSSFHFVSDDDDGNYRIDVPSVTRLTD